MCSFSSLFGGDGGGEGGIRYNWQKFGHIGIFGIYFITFETFDLFLKIYTRYNVRVCFFQVTILWN